MRWLVTSRVASIGAILGVLACGETAADHDGSGGAGGQDMATGGAGGHSAPLSLADQNFEPFSAWASPIDDYLQAGAAEVGNDDFMRAIQDLAVFEDRLYLSYGDANHNLGRVIPIGLRYFADPNTPIAVNEFDTDEEQIERYRHVGDELWAAGVDATEDAWLGNVYVREANGNWSKQRTVPGGVHVHDVAAFGGSHYAVGSGATEMQWKAGDIYAHLWRTKDGGDNFEILEQAHNGGNGDARWVGLLPVGQRLFLFGYTSNAEFKIDNLIGAQYDGSSLTMFSDDHPLRWVFTLGTDTVSNGRGLVRGANIMGDPLVHAAWAIDETGETTSITELADKTIVDVFHHPQSDETLLLSYDGNDYQAGFTLKEWTVRVLVTKDFSQFTEKLNFVTSIAPASIAYFRGALFYGQGDGQVLKAAATN